jgi:hypothetical protein
LKAHLLLPLAFQSAVFAAAPLEPLGGPWSGFCIQPIES